MRAHGFRAAAPVAAGLAVAVLWLSGCGGGSGGTPTIGTGTSTTTAKSTAKPTATKTTKPPTTAAVSTVKGRVHDVGQIVGTKTAGGLTILVLNRFTVLGLSDDKLAKQGAPLQPHSDDPYADENKSKTYLVPVNPDATFTINTCDSKPNPPTMVSTPISRQDFLAGKTWSKYVVLLTYDPSGRLVRLDTDPGC